MARSDSHKQKDHFIDRKFYGKVSLLSTDAFAVFQKDGIAQKLLHQIKYDNKPELATELGKRYGMEIKEHVLAYQYDVLVPVPLHAHKLKIRGYNQSMQFAEGLSESLKIPVLNVLKRLKATETQTRKSRVERWENVGNIFEVQDPSIAGKRVLLVDDVVTTGSTLEACANALYSASCQVGIITLAAAK